MVGFTLTATGRCLNLEQFIRWNTNRGLKTYLQMIWWTTIVGVNQYIDNYWTTYWCVIHLFVFGKPPSGVKIWTKSIGVLQTHLSFSKKNISINILQCQRKATHQKSLVYRDLQKTIQFKFFIILPWSWMWFYKNWPWTKKKKLTSTGYLLRHGGGSNSNAGVFIIIARNKLFQ